MNADLSIVIPYYETQVSWLMECLESIKGAANRHPEVKFHTLLIDDCSVKQPASAILKQEDWLGIDLAILKSSENCGPAGCRNLGLWSVPDEHYVLFLDSDDLLVEIPDLSQSEVFLCATTFFFQSTSGLGFDKPAYVNLPSRLGDFNRLSPKQLLEHLLLSNLFPVSAYVFKKSSLSGLEFDKKMRANEDWKFWIEATLRWNRNGLSVLSVQSALSSIRRNPKSLSHQFDKVLFWRSSLFQDLVKAQIDPLGVSSINSMLWSVIVDQRKHDRLKLLCRSFVMMLLTFFCSTSRGQLKQRLMLCAFACVASVTPSTARDVLWKKQSNNLSFKKLKKL